jgi:putative PIN family toxin of toxin-antitoxin system
VKIVLDTNVLISGIFWRGAPRQLLDAWRTGLLSFVVSEEIATEYERVVAILSARYPRSASLASEIMQLLIANSLFVTPIELGGQICTDPDDDKFLACALATSVDHIVTGDRALLIAGPRVGVSAISPRKCLALLGITDSNGE